MSKAFQSFIFMMTITTSTIIFSSDSNDQNQSFLSELDQRQVQHQRSTAWESIQNDIDQRVVKYQRSQQLQSIENDNNNTRARARMHLMHPINTNKQYLYFSNQPVAHQPCPAFYTTFAQVSAQSPCTRTNQEMTDEEKKTIKNNHGKYQIWTPTAEESIRRIHSANFTPITESPTYPKKEFHNLHYRPTKTKSNVPA